MHTATDLYARLAADTSGPYIGRHRATCDVPPTALPAALRPLERAAHAALALIGGRWPLALLTAALTTAALLTAATAPATDCSGVDVTDTAPATVNQMRADGWHADPTDGREALYPPACHTPQSRP